jgi:hypothetical protein
LAHPPALTTTPGSPSRAVSPTWTVRRREALAAGMNFPADWSFTSPVSATGRASVEGRNGRVGKAGGRGWLPSAESEVTAPTHVVGVRPLAEAWRSGARSWTTTTRQAFANDLTDPQLIAVTDNVNQSKGDPDPSTWQPSLASFRCTYARMWIAVKHHWTLTLQAPEKTALQAMLNTCP